MRHWGGRKPAAPTRRPGQARLALRTGSMSPKSYSLSSDWLQSPPPSLLPFAPPATTTPLGLPSNRGRVAEIFSLLQAKARQNHGPRRGVGWGLCSRGTSLSRSAPGCGQWGDRASEPKRKRKAEASSGDQADGCTNGDPVHRTLEEAAEPSGPGLSPHLPPTDCASWAKSFPFSGPNSTL